MGLMDNIKNAQEMAKQAQQNAANPPDMTGGALGGMEGMQKMQKIANEGLDGTCTIKSVEETGNVDPAGSKEFKIVCDASLGGDSYEATAMQFLHEKSVDAYQVGGKFNIKADPDDKTAILLMGGAD
jgi:hypothetical protein